MISQLATTLERTWRVAPRRCFGVALVLASLTACTRVSPRVDVPIAEVSPREVDIGDRITIEGEGFPVGRVAHVTLRGVARRPGRDDESIVLATKAEAASATRFSFAFDERLAETACGGGDGALHATFVGDLDLAFDATDPTLPMLGGHRQNVVFDLCPSRVGPSREGERLDAAHQTLDGLGLVLDARPLGGGGFLVKESRSGAPSARASVRTGDVVVSIDGVHLLSLADVVPSDARERRIEVARGGERDHGRVDTIRVRVEHDGEGGAATPFLVVALAAAAIVVRAIVPASVSTSFASATAWMARKRAARRASPTLELQDPALFATSIVCGIGTFALPALVNFAGPAADVMVAFSATLGIVALVSWLVPTRAPTRVRLALSDAIVAGLATTVGVAAAGSLSIADIVRARGSSLADWTLVRDPFALLVAVAFASTIARRSVDASLGQASATVVATRRAATPSLKATTAAAPEIESIAPLATPRSLILSAVGSAAFVVLFLGGWRPASTGAGELVGALTAGLIFTLKVAAVVAAAHLAVAMRPSRSLDAEVRRAWLVRLPIAVVGTVGSIAAASSSGAARSLHAAAIALVVVAMVWLARVAYAARVVTVVHADPVA